MSSPPTVYVAVPTGNIKEYASLYMLASLRNIYYPPEKLSINVAITDRGDEKSKGFIKRFRNLVANAEMPFPFHIHVTKPTEQEVKRWGPYCAVIKNLHHLRLDFLDGDADYFWVLGGDNPPESGTLRKLLKLEADVAGALILQRPLRGRQFDPDGDRDANIIKPICWQYVWTPRDVEKRRDLEPKLRHSLLRSWIEMPPMRISVTHNELMRECNFGSGCSLAKRTVMEHIGYYLGNGYHSEDIHFGQWANFLGFTTCLDPNTRCRHFDPDGRLY